ncbi:hypothetical protein [Virgibacillus sp. DJP39]|uniref:hypothetical protein n=1 Tax=Virgibacillus sp. DJP39 TaxID=3409790 RepID=UPI003BB6046D
MGAFLSLIGFFGLGTFLGLSLVSGVRRNGKMKKHLAYAAVALVILFIGVIISPTG